MTSWKLSTIAKATNGKLMNAPEDDLFIYGLQQDSRKIEPGFLFVPLLADRNGHDFIEQARAAGAVASFWSDSLEKAPTDFPLILVDDTLKALQDTAVWYLKEVNPKVVGITGSNGKTTTKDMTAKILEAKYNTHKTSGNFNNHIGLPLTLLNMPSTTEIVVLEMGMSNPGEIEFLSKLVHPDVAVVTMIGESHIQAFGTRENLAKEKLAITTALKDSGLFIYPADEQLIMERLPQNVRLKSVSSMGDADIYAKDIVEHKDLTQFTLIENTKERQLEMEIPVPGRYNVNNALMAILVGLEFGISLETSRKQLKDLKITKNRLEWIPGIHQWSLLNDAYNASPSSMKAVLTYFNDLKTSENKVLVLGDILELGEASAQLHAGLATAINLKSYDLVFLYGPEMQALYNELAKSQDSSKVFYFKENKDELLQALQDRVKKASYILFKSSNGTDLLSVVESLRLPAE